MQGRRGFQADFQPKFRVLEELDRLMELDRLIACISPNVLHEGPDFDDVQYAVPVNVLPPTMPPIREDEDAQALPQELELLLQRATRTADFKTRHRRTPTPTPPYNASRRSSRAASGRRWADLRR